MGAGADVKELEYVIALQQTSKETRSNASVSSADILALLRSQYSMNHLSHEQLIQVVQALGGGDTQVDDPSKGEDTSSLSKFTKKSNEVLGDVFGKVKNRLHLPHHSSHSQESDLDAATKRSSGEGGDIRRSENSNVKTSTEKISRLMKQLTHLHARHQQGAHDDDHTMHSLRELITADLKAKVLERAKSSRNLVIPPDNDDDDENDENEKDNASTESMEIQFVPQTVTEEDEDKEDEVEAEDAKLNDIRPSVISSIGTSTEMNQSDSFDPLGKGDIEEGCDARKNVSFCLHRRGSRK